MKEDFNIALAGVGVVGSGLLQLINSSKDHLHSVTGLNWKVVSAAVKNKNKKRPELENSNIRIASNPIELLNDDIDVVVELMGGEGDPAYSLIKRALEKGIPVVTANKALIAKHSKELAILSDKHGGILRFEAAVCGALPIVKAFRESLATNTIASLAGILNGTCNYILNVMHEQGASFDDAIKMCQKAGYAEANPSTDVEGYDAAHKLAILSSMALGAYFNTSHIDIRGITDISPEDVDAVKRHGYAIKLIGESINTKSNKYNAIQMVAPILLESNSFMAGVAEVDNAVIINGNFCGNITIQGLGAGGSATASAVSADLAGIALERKGATLGCLAKDIKDLDSRDENSFYDFTAPWFLRVNVDDKVGILAGLTKVFTKYNASIKSAQQSAQSKGVEIVFITHSVKRSDIDKIFKELSKMQGVKDLNVFRIGFLKSAE